MKDFKIFHRTNTPRELFFKVPAGKSFMFVEGGGESLAIFFEYNEPHRPRLQALFPEFEKILGVSRDNFTAKIVGPSHQISELKEFLALRGINVVKAVEREESFDLIYYSQMHRIRISTVQSGDFSPLPKGKIKVLIVDDSKTIRNLLEKVIGRDSECEIIGSLGDPLEVENFLKKNKPDVITLDIHMPSMNGVELLKKVYPVYGIPTIMISSISMEEGPLVLEALENGAFDYIQKPCVADLRTVGPKILEKIKLAPLAKRQVISQLPGVPSRIQATGLDLDSLILIGSSTGGTEAIRQILTRLPENIPPILIVQHIPPVFSAAFARRMDSLCPFSVVEASDGERVLPGHVYIAPGGIHMGIKKAGGQYKIFLSDSEPVNRFRPSVDFLFKTANPICENQNTIGVMLTGMGRDGATEMKALHDKGVLTIAQNEESCIVYGMPREAVERGAVDYEIHLQDIAAKIINLSKKKYKKAN